MKTSMESYRQAYSGTQKMCMMICCYWRQKKEQADPSEIPNLSSSNKDPDVLWNSMKNKFSRMPKDQMNYLIYFS